MLSRTVYYPLQCCFIQLKKLKTILAVDHKQHDIILASVLACFSHALLHCSTATSTSRRWRRRRHRDRGAPRRDLPLRQSPTLSPGSTCWTVMTRIKIGAFKTGPLPKATAAQSGPGGGAGGRVGGDDPSWDPELPPYPSTGSASRMSFSRSAFPSSTSRTQH